MGDIALAGVTLTHLHGIDKTRSIPSCMNGNRVPIPNLNRPDLDDNLGHDE